MSKKPIGKFQLSTILVIAAVSLGTLVFAPSVLADLSFTFSSGTGVAVTASNYTASGALNLSLGFVPAPGTNLTVVSNTGTAFISGTFNGVPQGGTVPLTYNGVTYNYIANYYGGNGRSLVLQWPCIGLVGWGDNSLGQLGNNSTTSSLVPVTAGTSEALAGKTVTALAEGRYYSLALTSDGQVFAWGSNPYGQLGNGSTTSSLVPVQTVTSGALAGKTVVAIAAGDWHSMALTSDGQVFTWGYNNKGQLGNSGTINSSVPVAVDMGGKTVVAIAAGSANCMALTSDGQVFDWGSNGNGQLGNNSPTGSTAFRAL